MFIFFVKQKTAYEMRISDWSSDVCSSDLPDADGAPANGRRVEPVRFVGAVMMQESIDHIDGGDGRNDEAQGDQKGNEAVDDAEQGEDAADERSEERRVGKECVST